MNKSTKKKRWTPLQFAFRFNQLKAAVQRRADVLKEWSEKLENFEKEMYSYMEEFGPPSFKDRDGTTYYMREDNYPSIKDRDALNQWLKENGLEDMIEQKPPAVNAQRLRGLYNERLKEGKSLPAGVDTFTKQRIGTRKA